MRPIYQQSGIVSGSGATYNFPPIVPDINIAPGNANWVVVNVGGGTATVGLQFTNEDPFAPGPFAPVWITEPAAFTGSTGTAQATVTLTSNQGAVGAYSFLPRAMRFVLTNCSSNPSITVEFVQASGGRS